MRYKFCTFMAIAVGGAHGARLASRASLCGSLFASLSPTILPSSPLPSHTRSYAATQSSLFQPRLPPRFDPALRRFFARGFSALSATVAVGDRLPDATFSYLDKAGNLQLLTVADLSKGKKVVLFAVPGAFTPTCSQQHLPGFVQKADEMRAKGVDNIACVAVNDAFVLRAWGESIGVKDKVLLLCDVNCAFTKALGVTLDLSDKPAGLGVRSRRYSLLADDGVVKVLNLEEGGSFTTSGAEEILKVL